MLSLTKLIKDSSDSMQGSFHDLVSPKGQKNTAPESIPTLQSFSDLNAGRPKKDTAQYIPVLPLSNQPSIKQGGQTLGQDAVSVLQQMAGTVESASNYARKILDHPQFQPLMKLLPPRVRAAMLATVSGAIALAARNLGNQTAQLCQNHQQQYNLSAVAAASIGGGVSGAIAGAVTCASPNLLVTEVLALASFIGGFVQGELGRVMPKVFLDTDVMDSPEFREAWKQAFSTF